jgi:hypothetical protein
MRVSELTEGMLVRPKEGFVFSIWSSTFATTDYQQLECRRRIRKYTYREPNRKVFKNPVIYMGKAPRDASPRDWGCQYEARHEAFVTFAGKKMRVAPEAWRNMEPVND